MEEALKLIKSNKIYKDIFKEVYVKYKKYGKITGSFTMVSKSNEDKEVLINFDQRVIYNGKAKIKCSLVEELFKRKLKNTSFIELMEIVIGKEAVTNKEERVIEAERKEKFFQSIIEKSMNGRGKNWFINLKENKLNGYNSLIKKFNEFNKEDNLDYLINEIILVLNSLNDLPIDYGKHESIAVFAAKKTKNPHFFDSSRYTGRLFMKGLEYILGKDYLSKIDEINELYYEAGILKDEISNHTTIFGFLAYDKNSKEIAPINLFREWNQPLQISVRNLTEVNYFEAINDEVYVFENPAVFDEILRKSKSKVSLVCTSGQLNLSSYMVFDKISNLKKIYYAGDFDPEGILIADKIKSRYKDKVEFLLYDKTIYEKILSDNKINSTRLAKLNKAVCIELNDIKDAIKKKKLAAYQELIIQEYINIINKKN